MGWLLIEGVGQWSNDSSGWIGGVADDIDGSLALGLGLTGNVWIYKIELI